MGNPHIFRFEISCRHYCAAFRTLQSAKNTLSTPVLDALHLRSDVAVAGLLFTIVEYTLPTLMSIVRIFVGLPTSYQFPLRRALRLSLPVIESSLPCRTSTVTRLVK